MQIRIKKKPRLLLGVSSDVEKTKQVLFNPFMGLYSQLDSAKVEFAERQCLAEITSGDGS